MRALLLFLPLLLVAARPPSMPAAEVPGTSRTLSVTGHGEAKGKPDQATLTVGVRSEAPTADAALKEDEQKSAALLKVLKDAGIADKDIQTTTLRVDAVYAPSNGRQSAVTGYAVTHQLDVTVRVLDKVGPLVSSLVRSGANQLDAIRFELGQPQPLADQARMAAMEDAQRKAHLLARLAGVQLGQVLSISEEGAGPRPMLSRAAPMMAMSESMPVQPGEITSSADVHVVWTIR